MIQGLIQSGQVLRSNEFNLSFVAQTLASSSAHAGLPVAGSLRRPSPHSIPLQLSPMYCLLPL